MKLPLSMPIFALALLNAVGNIASAFQIAGSPPGPTGSQTSSTRTISGTLVAAGTALPVTSGNVALSGTQSQVTSVDSSGKFIFTGLAPGGTYTVTPSSAGLTFEPANVTFASLSDSSELIFVTRQLGVTITRDGSQTTAWTFEARYARQTQAAYGFYHFAVADTRNGNIPTGTFCQVAGYVNGYTEPGASRLLFVLNPPDGGGGIGNLTPLTADVQDNRACALDAKTSRIWVASDGTVILKVTLSFKPWFTVNSKSIHVMQAECCWTGGAWSYQSTFVPGLQRNSISPADGNDRKRTFFLSLPYPKAQANQWFDLQIGEMPQACYVRVLSQSGVLVLVDGAYAWRPQVAAPYNDQSYAGTTWGMWIYTAYQDQIWPAIGQSVSTAYCRVTVNPSQSIHVAGNYYDPNAPDTTGQGSYYLYQTTNPATGNLGTVTTTVRLTIEMLPSGAFIGPKNIYLRMINSSQQDGPFWQGVWNVQ